jgi:hypothetical protein
LLDEAHVNFDEVLFLALSLTLALLFLRLDVGLFRFTALDFLGGIPLLVLAAFVGGTGFLHTEIATPSSGLLSEVVGVGLGLVNWLLGSSLAFGRGLGLVLIGLGNGLASLFVVPLGIALLSTPALANLLVGVTVIER